MMRFTRLLITMLLLLSAMAALTYSQSPVKLDGSEGMALLQSLTKATPGLNNTSLNATNNSSIMATTGSSNASDSLWSWGSKPKDPPLGQDQSSYDFLNDSA